jgi:hypothetical protein
MLTARVRGREKERSLERTLAVYIQREREKDKNLIIARRARVDVDHCGKSDRVMCFQSPRSRRK